MEGLIFGILRYPRKGKLTETKNHTHQVKTPKNINALALRIHTREKLTPKTSYGLKISGVRDNAVEANMVFFTNQIIKAS